MKAAKHSPFNLDNDKAYQQWRTSKLANATSNNNKKVISIKMTSPPLFDGFLNNTQKHTNNNLFKITKLIQQSTIDNYCLYRIPDCEKYNESETKQLIQQLAQQCGLTRLDNNLCADNDSLTSICRTTHAEQHDYIPYSNKKMSWHTDGYYNPPQHAINSMLLHCYRSADNGGESAFIDHEIVYILLRDENPKWIEALCNQSCMTIPDNILNGEVIRAAQTGPVFTLSPTGRLHMRYSARKKNIIWQQNDSTLEALTFLQALLDPDITTDSKVRTDYIIRHKFRAGEGLMSRNVLHSRNAFVDNSSPKNSRLLFRGRFYDELPHSVALHSNRGSN